MTTALPPGPVGIKEAIVTRSTRNTSNVFTRIDITSMPEQNVTKNGNEVYSVQTKVISPAVLMRFEAFIYLQNISEDKKRQGRLFHLRNGELLGANVIC